MEDLRAWGWSDRVAESFERLGRADLDPGRVVDEGRGQSRIVTTDGVRQADLTGRLRLAGQRPVVGDWVAASRPGAEGRVTIQLVLPRRGSISRRLPGRIVREQVLAANLDTVFLVTSCNEDFSPRRVERYLTIIWDSGALPVVLINKADLVDDASGLIADAERSAPGVAVHAVSATAPDGLRTLRPYLREGRTCALLGSSGVGKSTIVNRVIGADVQSVRDVRQADAKGRHTTTRRALFLLPGGGLLVDTPGLREVGLWQTETGLEQTFSDVEALAPACRFHDCAHETEPGCAVLAAVERGELEQARLESYHRLRRELEFLDRKLDPEARASLRRRWRSVHKDVRQARKKGWLR